MIGRNLRASVVGAAIALSACGSAAETSLAAPEGFPGDRIYLVCGNDDGAPNELSGCSVGLDGTFEPFGNSVRTLTQPLANNDGTLLAFAEPNGEVVLRNSEGEVDLRLSLPGLSGPLDWSVDGRYLLVSDRSALVVVDLDESRRSGEPSLQRTELPEGQDVLGLARFSPDGESMAVGTKEADIEQDEAYRMLVIDRLTEEITFYGEQLVERDPTTFTGTVADPAFDPSGDRLAWADGISGDLSVLTISSGEVETLTLAEPPELITGVSWSPTGLIVVGIDARLQLVNPDDGMTINQPLPADWSITSSAPAWSRDGMRFVTTVQHPQTEALLDLVLVDLEAGSVELLTSSTSPTAPVSTFPGFPVWPQP